MIPHAAVLTAPVTAQQLLAFTPARKDGALGAGSSGESVAGPYRADAWLPQFVLADGSSYYGELHAESLLPHGMGVMIFKDDASGCGTPYTRLSSSRVPSSSSPSQTEKQRLDELLAARSQLLLALTRPHAAGDRYGGTWREGSCDGQGVLITASFRYQGTFSEGKPHGKGNITYDKSYVDRVPAAGTADALENGVGAFLLKSLTSALLAPLPELLVGDGREGAGWAKPREYIGDYDKTFLRHGEGMMKYANGDVYDGEWKYNRREGFGKFASADTGERYEGSWSHDERHGYGKLFSADGSFFKGLFVHGMRHGEGLLLFPNGDEFYGSFEKNRIQGEGTMKYKNGDAYEGSWRDGLRHGEGRSFLKRRNISVRGTFVKGLMEGSGVVEYPGTGVFAGRFERGERQRGTMFWFTADEARQQSAEKGSPSAAPVADDAAAASGAASLEDPRRCYQGDWVGENMHGRGLLWFKNGDFFSGYFVKNMRQGPGNLRYSSSGSGRSAAGSPAREYSGFFAADCRHGLGIEQSADGSIKAGRWENDAFVEGYQGEWDNRSFNGVGRLLLCLSTFFSGLDANNNSSNSSSNSGGGHPAAASYGMSAPPPISVPALTAFGVLEPGTMALSSSASPVGGAGSNSSISSVSASNARDAALYSVFNHPAKSTQYAAAHRDWASAAAVAHDLNALFMVEYFGVFRNGRRDGTGVMRLPVSCDWMPSSAASAEAAASEAAAAAAAGAQKKRAKRGWLGGRRAETACHSTGPPGAAEPLDKPTLLVRRHVLKGQWENNVLDCAHGVWAFPDGETYVGGFAHGARHQPSSPDAAAVATAGKDESDANGGYVYFPDGSVFVGGWWRDAPLGKGTFLYKGRQKPVFERRVEGLARREGSSAIIGDGDDCQDSASKRRRRELRQSLTRQSVVAEDASTAAGRDLTDAAAPRPEAVESGRKGQTAHADPGGNTLSGLLGIDFVLQIFTGATSDDSDSEQDAGRTTPRTAAGRPDAKERLVRTFTGFEDAYYLFGDWRQEDALDGGPLVTAERVRACQPAVGSSGDGTGRVASREDAGATSALMPYGEYARRILPRLNDERDLALDRYALSGVRSTREDTAIGIRPPGPQSPAWRLEPSPRNMSAALLSGSGGGGGPASSNSNSAGATDAYGRAGAGGALSEAFFLGLSRDDPGMRPPAPPAALNVSRVSGEAIAFFPSTGVCVQQFFLDSMPRLVVPNRPGSDYEAHLARMKHLFGGVADLQTYTLPSDASDYAWLFTSQVALAGGGGLDAFSPAEALLEGCPLRTPRLPASPLLSPAAGAPSPTSSARRTADEEPSGPTACSRTQGLGISTAYVAGAARPHSSPSDAVATPTPSVPARPSPLALCTFCGKAYSFFREATCCSLCFRSACTSCLNSVELLGHGGGASGSGRGRATGESSGSSQAHDSRVRNHYSAVSALLASSYYLLQKLQKGPPAFAADNQRFLAAAAAAALDGRSVRATASLEVSSKDLLALLSATPTLPICADCVRVVLLRVQKQMQWIPLRLFSSVVKFENEDRAETAARAIAIAAAAAAPTSGPQERQISTRQNTDDEADLPASQVAPTRTAEVLRCESQRLADEEAIEGHVCTPAADAVEAAPADGGSAPQGSRSTPTRHGPAPGAADVPSPLPLPPPPPPSALPYGAAEGNEGYVVYCGYTSHGVPHLFGELWWWPSASAHGPRPPAPAAGCTRGPASGSRQPGEQVLWLEAGLPSGSRRQRARRRGGQADAPGTAVSSGPSLVVSDSSTWCSGSDNSSSNNATANASRASLPTAGARVFAPHAPVPHQRYHYVGGFAAGARSGHGTIVYENGERFVGSFRDNRVHGEGFYFSDDGSVLHGMWRRDRLTSVLYVGEVHEADLLRHGRGLCFYEAVRRSNSIFFAGHHAQSGAGAAATAAAGAGSCAVSKEQQVQPQRLSLLPPGATDGVAPTASSLFLTYNGEWRRGQRHGSGVLRMVGGVTYVGRFHRDRVHGRGAMYSPFSTYYGEFSQDAKFGHGIEFFFDTVPTANGTRESPAVSAVEGEWRQDVSHGFVRVYERARRASRATQQSQPSNTAAPAAVCADFEVTETTYRDGTERDDCFAPPEMRRDADCAECAVCGRAFHLFLRRHHCRLCGDVVCDACSPRRAQLPEHFSASVEQCDNYQSGVKAAAAVAVEQPSAFPRRQADSGDDRDKDATESTSSADAAAEGGARGSAPVPTASASPQRVCECCFLRLEQRRRMVIHMYADRSVYCGCLSQGRWVSRGLYWRADGLFFVFDQKGKLIDGSTRCDSNTKTGMGNAAGVASASVLQDASPSKELLDSPADVLRESSPVAALDDFLNWWAYMNKRCLLSLGKLDVPQLRVHKSIRCSPSGSTTQSQPSPPAACIAVGSPEAARLSVRAIYGAIEEELHAERGTEKPPVSCRSAEGASLRSGSAAPSSVASTTPIPSPTSPFLRALPSSAPRTASPVSASGTSPTAPRGAARLARKWTAFPTLPAVRAPPAFVSLSDAMRCGGEAPSDDADKQTSGEEPGSAPPPVASRRNVEAALMRAASFRPSLLTRPPPYPFAAPASSEERRGGVTPGSPPSAEADAAAGDTHSPALFSPPVPLARADITDEQLLKAVADERVNLFPACLPPSQMPDDDDNATPQQEGTGEAAITVLACDNYTPLFPATPDPPAFGVDRVVSWSTWNTHEVPVFNASRLMPQRRQRQQQQTPASSHSALGFPPAPATMLDERSLYHGCPLPLPTVGDISEVIENGKVQKVSSLMVEKERRTNRLCRRAARRAERREQKQRRAAAQKGLRSAEVHSSASSRSLSSNSSASDAEGAKSSAAASHSQAATMLSAAHSSTRAWLPEQLAGPFRLQLYSNGI